MKVIVAGSRDFTDYDEVKRVLNHFRRLNPIDEIVSGKSRGADTLGEQYAKEHSIEIAEFPAKWNDTQNKPDYETKRNKSGNLYWVKAGFARNEEMAKYADCLIAFWDGKSPGTGDMIKAAKRYDLTLIICKI